MGWFTLLALYILHGSASQCTMLHSHMFKHYILEINFILNSNSSNSYINVLQCYIQWIQSYYTNQNDITHHVPLYTLVSIFFIEI